MNALVVKRRNKQLKQMKHPATEIGKANKGKPKDFQKMYIERIFVIPSNPYGC